MAAREGARRARKIGLHFHVVNTIGAVTPAAMLYYYLSGVRKDMDKKTVEFEKNEKQVALARIASERDAAEHEAKTERDLYARIEKLEAYINPSAGESKIHSTESGKPPTSVGAVMGSSEAGKGKEIPNAKIPPPGITTPCVQEEEEETNALFRGIDGIADAVGQSGIRKRIMQKKQQRLEAYMKELKEEQSAARRNEGGNEKPES